MTCLSPFLGGYQHRPDHELKAEGRQDLEHAAHLDPLSATELHDTEPPSGDTCLVGELGLSQASILSRVSERSTQSAYSLKPHDLTLSETGRKCTFVHIPPWARMFSSPVTGPPGGSAGRAGPR